MKKIPYGKINFKELIEENCYYVDKTMYLEKLEDNDDTLIYLRPGRFGKSLFTSMMFYYYDLNSKDLFDSLFKDTYIYQHPTKNKNNYYVLKFDFSGIGEDKSNLDLKSSFKLHVTNGIEEFCDYYHFDYAINEEAPADDIIVRFLSYFKRLQLKQKMYIIVDEYDNFTNAILEGDTSKFKSLVNGIVKSFYANIKIYIKEGTVGRFFATGICPITLNSMTTGFNIATDLSTDYNMHNMIGLTHDEVLNLIKEVVLEKDQEKAYKIMLENYDGYLFNEEIEQRVFNATLVMYFLSRYEQYQKFPKKLYDSNIVVNYGKIDNILKIKNNNMYLEIIEKILKTDEISGNLVDKFNLLENITANVLISLLYYFGYLTIKEAGIYLKFTIPNQIMKETYANYFLNLLEHEKLKLDDTKIMASVEEITNEGTINNITNYVSEILTSLGSRSFMKFDEKYIQLLYYALIKHPVLKVKIEYPVGMGYVDLMIFSNDEMAKYNLMIEFKYLKKNEFNESLLNEKIKEGTEQLKSYNLESKLPLKKYLVVFVGNENKYLEEIK